MAGDAARMKMDVNQREKPPFSTKQTGCLLYTSDAADDMQCVDLGGRRIIKKKKKKKKNKKKQKKKKKKNFFFFFSSRRRHTR